LKARRLVIPFQGRQLAGLTKGGDLVSHCLKRGGEIMSQGYPSRDRA
jgi:hypothetical protein